MREHNKSPGSAKLEEEVAKLAQAFKDARPTAAPKKETSAKAKAKIDQVLAAEAKRTAGDGFVVAVWRHKKQKEKFIREREICDAESIINFGDGKPAPRLKSFEDGESGYQVTSAGKLAEAMMRYVDRGLDDEPFLLITPAARAFNTPPEQWRLWVARFFNKEVTLFFIDPADAAAAPK